MLSLSTKIRVESTLHPGVVFILKKMTDKRRINLRLQIAEISAEVEQAQKAVAAFGPFPFADVEEKDITDDQKAARLLWFNETAEPREELERMLDDKVYPIWVEWALEKIEGLDVDGETVTGKNAGDLLPQESGLYNELVRTIEDHLGLGGKRAANLESPITFSAPVDGQTSDSTAQPVNESDFTGLVTAESISPAK